MSSVSELSFGVLKAKHRAVRDDFPEPTAIRIHRALSWLRRAEKEQNDDDVRFILLWIGFNSAYANNPAGDQGKERRTFKGFAATVVALDGQELIYDAVWNRFPGQIKRLISNKYVFEPFWKHENGLPGNANWAAWLQRDQRAAEDAVEGRNTERLLSILLERLYVLRNQLLHGGATWNGKLNRTQVRDGAAIMNCLLPVFLDMMLDNPDREWGLLSYPVLDK